MLFFNIFSFSLGITVLVILWFFYGGNKHPGLLKFNFMMISFWVMLCLDLIPGSFVTALNSAPLLLWIKYLRGTFALAFIVFVPLFAHSLFPFKFERVVTRLSIIVALTMLIFHSIVVFTSVGMIQRIDFIFHILWSLFLIIVVSYSSIIFALFYRDIKQNQIRTFIKVCALITFLLLPFLVTRDFLYLNFFKLYLPDDFHFRTILYLLLNVFTIVFFFRYYFVMIVRTLPESLQASFIQQHHITPREKEVIELLIQGKSYKQISEELFISISTVKSHVYSVYKKSGTGNKTALLRLIQKS